MAGPNAVIQLVLLPPIAGNIHVAQTSVLGVWLGILDTVTTATVVATAKARFPAPAKSADKPITRRPATPSLTPGTTIGCVPITTLLLTQIRPRTRPILADIQPRKTLRLTTVLSLIPAGLKAKPKGLKPTTVGHAGPAVVLPKPVIVQVAHVASHPAFATSTVRLPMKATVARNAVTRSVDIKIPNRCLILINADLCTATDVARKMTGAEPTLLTDTAEQTMTKPIALKTNPFRVALPIVGVCTLNRRLPNQGTEPIPKTAFGLPSSAVGFALGVLSERVKKPRPTPVDAEEIRWIRLKTTPKTDTTGCQNAQILSITTATAETVPVQIATARGITTADPEPPRPMTAVSKRLAIRPLHKPTEPTTPRKQTSLRPTGGFVSIKPSPTAVHPPETRRIRQNIPVRTAAKATAPPVDIGVMIRTTKGLQWMDPRPTTELLGLVKLGVQESQSVGLAVVPSDAISVLRGPIPDPQMTRPALAGLL